MKRQGSPAGRIPLSRRLEQRNRGLAGDERVIEAKLACINAFPLELWFGEHQERLEQLSRAFPDISGQTAFGAAAAALWEARANPRSREGMWLLLSPLLDIDRHMVKLENGCVYRWGAR